MKQLTTYNRAASYLNKIYDMLNAEFFDNQLSRPTITIQSTPKAFGHISVSSEMWVSKNGSTRELNLGAGSLNRPVELLTTTVLHEMCHQYSMDILERSDCSRSGFYHNRLFKQVAEEHGLIVKKHPTYGYCITEPSDRLLEWLLTTDLVDIQIHRNEGYGIRVTGTGTHDGNGTDLGGAVRKSSSRKYQCPCCRNSVRATKTVHIQCLDCQAEMELVTP